jgi:hypothetical protein
MYSRFLPYKREDLGPCQGHRRTFEPKPRHITETWESFPSLARL